MMWESVVRQARVALVLAAAPALVLMCCGNTGEGAKQARKQRAETTPNVTITRYALAPDVEFKALDGSTVRLSSFRGKMVILSFLATWNRDCASQILELNKLRAKVQDPPLAILGVVTDRTGKAALLSYMQKGEIRFPVYYNGEEIAARFGGIAKLPTTYVILRDGNIYAKDVGLRSTFDLNETIKAILQQRL